MTKLRSLGLLVSPLVLLVILMLAPPVALAQLPSAHFSPAAAAGLLSLPSGAQGPISAALGKDNSVYWIHASAAGLRGENPRQALTADFTKQGAEVRSHHLRWSLETRAYGYGDALRPLKTVAPQAKANRVEYWRYGVTEWYENGPLGLEQGFTLDQQPGKANGKPLTLELALRGDLVAALNAGALDKKGRALELRTRDGKAALRYTGLLARDAKGRELRSWLEVRGAQLLVRVEDEGAQYPIVVDPWIQQAELTSSDGAAGDEFSSAVAISGSTIVVGAPEHTVGSNLDQGAAYVFVESGGTWSQQAELTASDGASHDWFGGSVSVSGSTIVVGARLHQVGSNAQQGAVYVFVETGGTWSQQAELTASDGAANDQFGWSAAVSGSTVVVGAPYNNSPLGAAYVFAGSGGTWSQQAELTTFDRGADDSLGLSVAISGSTIVVTGVDSYLGQLVAFVFAQNGTAWSEQVELSVDYSGINAVAVDGSTIVLGDTYAGPNVQQGAAYVFVESGGTWSQQAVLTASDGAAFYHFGSSVAVGGNTVVVGSPNGGDSGFFFGTAYVFVESGGAWSQQAELADGVADDGFGGSVAVSGSALLVGAPNQGVGSNSYQGAAYGFGSSGPLYTLSAAPSSLSVGQGGQGTSTITITPSDGFSGSVLFSISGLPSGVTAAFDPNPATSATTLTLTPSGKAAATTSEFFVFGASGSLVQNAPLVLTVMAEPVVTLSSTSLNFGDEAVNGTSGAKTVTVKNTGTVTLDISGIAPSAQFEISGNTCGATLAVRKTCKVSVAFTPTQLGAVTGTLTFTDNALNSPQTVPLSGTGIAQAALTPASYTFKETKVGDTSYAHKFTLRNNLPTTLTGISYSTTGPFAVSASTCGTTLNSEATCAISVTFTPTQTGAASGTLSVTDSANNSPQSSNLTGTGAVH